MTVATPTDPTYDRGNIEGHPIWRLAFWLSEQDNDNAPIGWGRYIPIAEMLARIPLDELVKQREDLYRNAAREALNLVDILLINAGSDLPSNHKYHEEIRHMELRFVELRKLVGP